MQVSKHSTPNIMDSLRLADHWTSDTYCNGVFYRKEADRYAKQCYRFYIDQNFDGLARYYFVKGEYRRFTISLIYLCTDAKNPRGRHINCYLQLEQVDSNQEVSEQFALIIPLDYKKQKVWTPEKLFAEASSELNKLDLEGWRNLICKK